MANDQGSSTKMAVNWVSKTIRRMTRKRTLEQWETKITNCAVTPQVIWPIAESLPIRSGQKALSAVHDQLGPIFYRISEGNIIADCLESQFTLHDLRDYDHEMQVQARVQALLTTIDEDIPVKFCPCDVSNEIQGEHHTSHTYWSYNEC
jgi:hypothetical protein